MRKMKRWIAVFPAAATFCLLVAACGDGERKGGDQAARNAGGGALDAPDMMLAATLDTLYTVGVLEGEEWESFAGVKSVAFDAAGRLHVVDGGANHIVVVGPDGGLDHIVGRKGGGPGEFQFILSAAILDDGRLAVFDLAHGAFQLFDVEGAYVESASIDMTAGMPGQTLIPLPGGRLVSWGGIGMSLSGSDGTTLGDAPGEEGSPIRIFSLEEGTTEVIYRAWKAPPGEPGSTTAYSRQASSVGSLSDGRLVVADSTGYRIKLVGAGGGVESVIERPILPTPVTESIRRATREQSRLLLAEGALDAALQEGREMMDALMPGAGGGFTIQGEEATRDEWINARLNKMVFPDEIPVIERLAVDPEDRIWVSRNALSSEGVVRAGPTDLVTAGRRYLGTFPPGGPRIPDAFGPDGLMAYIETDELGVQRVLVARLRSIGPADG